MSGGSRRVEIVATLGPVSETRSCVEAMVRAGLDVVRLSMGNGSRERHTRAAGLVREAAAAAGRPVRLLADLQARKNRLGRFSADRVDWAAGDVVMLTAEPGEQATHRTWVTFPWVADRVPPGARVLIDDGAVILDVVDVTATTLRCTVDRGGVVTAGRGVSIPATTNVSPGLTDRDVDDLRFARRLGVDMVALSFACAASDYHDVRAQAPDQVVIGKVEHPAALANLPALAAAFDGLMVARGDLGVEIPYADVPFAQKRILAECRRRDRRAMVATQLLHSMRGSPQPTRAEVSDVANAVLDGADALVVTGETGYGSYPVRVIEVLHEVILRAEHHLGTAEPDRPRQLRKGAV